MVVYLTYCASPNSTLTAVESGEDSVELSSNLIINTTDINDMNGTDSNISFNVYAGQSKGNTSGTRGIYNIQYI